MVLYMDFYSWRMRLSADDAKNRHAYAHAHKLSRLLEGLGDSAYGEQTERANTFRRRRHIKRGLVGLVMR